MNGEIVELINQITRQRKLDRDFVIGALRDSISLAIRKSKEMDYEVEVEIDPKKGDVTVWVVKKVVDKISDPDREITIEEAKKLNPDVNPGDAVKVPIPFTDFGRSVVYKIQNVFLQKIREAEKQHIYRDFQEKVGEIMSGTIQKVDKTGVYISLGKAEAILPPEEQIPGEKYKQGGSIKALVLLVEDQRRRPQVVLSRTHPDFLRRLLEFEIPEVSEGTVEVKAVARIPGKRSKVAVRSKDPKVDPIGACIGIRGTRIQPIVKELSNEKIDVIKWDPDPIRFTALAMSPARAEVIYEDGDKIYFVVEDEKVPEAKGKEAQNVILASKLVGKEIVVIPLSEMQPPKDAVTILELEGIDEETIDKLRNAGFYVFKDIPSLAELVAVEGIDEQTALKILEGIEEKLEEKSQ